MPTPYSRDLTPSSDSREERLLDDAIDDTFPASDPISHGQPGSLIGTRYAALERDARIAREPTPLNRLARVLVRGSVANLASVAALAMCSKRETGSALAGINAVSHWAWGDAAARRNGFSWKYTITGALTNQIASMFWAFCFQRLFGSRHRHPTVATLLGEAAVTSALACAVDYGITPKRLTPGYELRLSKPSLLAVYIAFAGGLALGGLVTANRR